MLADGSGAESSRPGLETSERTRSEKRSVKKTIRVLAALWLSAVASAFAADPADTILVNGRIVTVDDGFTIAEAVAIRGQRIVAVGKNADVLELQSRGT